MQRLIIAIFLFFISSVALFSQETSDTTNNRGAGIVKRAIKDTIPEPDTLIYSWKYPENSFIKLYAEFDTTLLAIQLPEVYRREWPGFVYLGNPGTAVQNSFFSERRDIEVNWQIKNFYPYLKTHKKLKFYNTKTPYTQMQFVSGGQNYEYFTFNHTQNYDKHINLGMAYEIFNSEGYMIHQNTRNRNFSFWTDVDYNRYKMHGSINFNGVNVDENGGITSDYLLSDSSVSIQDINTKLSLANNRFSYFIGAIDHQFKLLKFGKDSIAKNDLWVAHHFSFDKMQRLYTDDGDEYKVPPTDEVFNFYDDTFNGTKSNDTTSFIDYKNRIAIMFESKGKTKIHFGPFVEHHHIDHSNLYRDTLFTYNNDTTIKTFSVGGQATIKKSDNFEIDIQALYYPFEDYNYQNYQITTNLVKWQKLWNDTLYMHLMLNHQEKTPDYLLGQYFSNHLKWVNNFQDENERKLQFNMRLIRSRINMLFTVNHIDNYIYFDENMRVAQHDEEIMMFGAKISKKFTFWKRFNFEIDLLGQYTATKFIDVPDFSAKGNFFYTRQINFKNTGGKIDIYGGVSGRIHTKYYAPAYAPAIAQFHLQDEKLIGNYPVINVFVGARVKRFLFSLRYDHVNSGLLYGKSYYSTYGYPLRPRNMRFSVSWNFYN